MPEPAPPNPEFEKAIKKARVTGPAVMYTGGPIVDATPEGYDSPQEAPNYDKLTRGERTVMNFLAGVGETKIGETLAKWSDGWLGKALNILDIPAEGLERITGFATQWALAQGSPEGEREFRDNLTYAWYAGSLGADFSNTPTWDSLNNRYTWPGDDLPGISGLVEARRRIAELSAGGMDPGQALVQVRNEAYESSGALAFRMQLHDAAFHILADPLNIAVGFLKPAELTNKFLVRVGAKVFRTPADEIAEASRVAEGMVEAQQLAVRTAQAAGNETDAARLAAEIPALQDIAASERAFAEFAVANKMSPLEEWVARIFKVSPDEPAKGIAAWKLNPLALTPGTRAMEYMNRVMDNVSTHLLSRVSDPEELLRIIKRSADGLFSPELGHHIITAEGRATRAALQTGLAHVEDGVAAFRASEQFEGPLIRGLAQVMETTPAHLVERLRGGELPALAEKLGAFLQTEQGRAMAALLQANGYGLDPQGLLQATERLKLFEQFPAWDADMFRYVLHNRLIDGIQEQAIKLFGVRAKGGIHQFADALKAAESLAFLKSNPTYPLINGVNNFTTMVATGSFGNPLTHYDELFKSLGLAEPARFRVGIGYAGLGESQPEVMSAFERASQFVRQAENGEAGTIGKITDWLRDRQGLGFAKLSQSLEAKASTRSFGVGFSRYMRDGWRPGKGYAALSEFDPSLAARLGPEMSKRVERIVQSAWSPSKLDEAFGAANPDLNIGNILEEASQRSGMNLENVLGPDFTYWMGQELVRAAQESPQSLNRAVSRIQKMVQTQIDNQMEVAVATITEEAAARVAAEGPGALPRVMSEVMDDFYGGHARHATEMAQIGDELRVIRDPKLRGRFWDRLAHDNEAYYGREWRRLEAAVDGSKKGLDNAMEQLRQTGRLTPELETSLKNMQRELRGTYDNWSGGWRKFYDRRKALFQELKDTKRTEFGAKLDAIQAELDTRYSELINTEDAHLLQMDSVLAQGLEPAEREMYMMYRNRVAELRRALRESVVDFRRQLAGAPAGERDPLWQEFWKGYHNQSERIQQSERASRIAMTGDPNAQFFMGLTQDEARVLSEARQSLLAGKPLATEQQALIDRFNQFRSVGREQAALRVQFGEFSEEAVQAKFSEWRRAQAQPEAPVGPTGIGPEPTEPVVENIHQALEAWIIDQDKSALLRLAEDPLSGAQEVQDFAQWWLREQGLDSIRLGPKTVRIQRGLKVGTLEEVQFRGFDSFTPVEQTARLTSGGGPIVELEVPVENIFTHVHAHPAFDVARHEAEFILNEHGVQGARIVRINGQVPSRQQIATLIKNNPGLLGQADEFPGAIDFFEQFGIPRQQVLGQNIDDIWFTRGSDAMAAIEEATRDIAVRPSLALDIPQEAQQGFLRYLDQVRGDMGNSLHAAYRMGEYHRDAALLNYNRRMNYNSWLGIVAPYEFWFTQSMGKWALGALDRHRVLSTYLRMQKFLETAYRPESGFPERLRGTVRVPMPFLPDWMGKDLFIDPLGLALPIKRFAFPFEQITEQFEGDRAKTERTLGELLNDGQINQQEYDFALQQGAGETWTRAQDLARLDDSQERLDPFDMLNMLVSPHAPLQWAYNVARGTPERIGTFLPITRSIRAVTALLGIAPNTGGLNIEGMVRKSLGLPAYDRWDDYRVDRMLANMVADGVISVGDSIQAMNDRDGPAFGEAVRRAGIEFGWGNMGSIIGLPTKAYPAGEEHLRELKNDYEAAWRAYEGGDIDAIGRFNDAHPEYEARLALFKKPEERMRNFLVDELWNTYNDMPDLNREEVREHLGDLFQSAFLSKDTRSYESVPNEIMAVWLKIMGGDPPGEVHFSETLTPVQLSSPDIAYRYQVFRDTRDQLFNYNETVWPLMEQYFRLKEGAARRSFLVKYPALKQYWDWRRDFMYRNPDIAPYIEDDPERLPQYPTVAAVEEAFANQPNFTAQEWRAALGQSSYNLVLDYLDGEDLPASVRNQLEERAEQLGLLDWQDLVEQVGAAP